MLASKQRTREACPQFQKGCSGNEKEVAKLKKDGKPQVADQCSTQQQKREFVHTPDSLEAEVSAKNRGKTWTLNTLALAGGFRAQFSAHGPQTVPNAFS